MESSLREYEVIRQWVNNTGERKLIYRVIRSEVCLEELDWVTTFGMEIVDCASEERSVLADISPNYDAVLLFAGRCSELEVLPAHLLDVAEDFLAAQYGAL
ncbi:MAG: hypothetical protein HFE44_03615 [Oscillospiraceae bacterium]|jgi:hypothetical protein|nr:hypothetical protein [Oscillospiraceae bacterium]